MPRRVAVVGGGALGVTAARDLAARGADVTLYERDEVGSGASGRAAGIAYDAFAEDVDAAVAERAVERFRDLDADGAVEFAEHPYVWFARAGDGRRTDVVRQSAERMRANGRDVTLLDADELADRFPSLASVDVAVAAETRDAGYLDPGEYVSAMADRAEAAGASVETGTRVALADDGTTVETPAGTEPFDSVLVAAGAHTKRLLAGVGVPIPMKPYRVQALVTEPFDGAGAVPTCYDATGGQYARPRDGGLLVGDGTQEREFDPDGYDTDANPAFERASLGWLGDTIGAPAASEVDGLGVQRSWAGLCTATPDRDPLLGRIEPGLYVATGWHGHGFMRAPALGERIAEEMLGGEGIGAFDPRRFDGDESFEVVEGMTVEE